MKILRTPDARFERLADHPFAPHFTTISTRDGIDLRIHHIDEGARKERWCCACTVNPCGAISTGK